MTKITIGKGIIEIRGHSGYGSIGTDIVCSAISTASQYLQNLTNCEYEETEDGYKLHISSSNINAVVYIDLMKQLEVQYKDYVKVIGG